MAAWAAPSHWRNRPAHREEKVMLARSPWLAGAALVFATVINLPGLDGVDAPTPNAEVTRVTGTVTFTADGSGGVGVFGDDALEWRESAARGEIRTNHEGLTGELFLNWNCDVFLPDYQKETSGAVATGSVVVQNGGGAWVGAWHGLTYPNLAGGQHHVVLKGAGPYEGYSALLYMTVVRGEMVVDGLTFPGDMPPIPEPPI
jgi:hypothetical protein